MIVKNNLVEAKISGPLSKMECSGIFKLNQNLFEIRPVCFKQYVLTISIHFYINYAAHFNEF